MDGWCCGSIAAGLDGGGRCGGGRGVRVGWRHWPHEGEVAQVRVEKVGAAK